MMSRRSISFSRKSPRRTCSCEVLTVVCALGLTTLLLFALEHKNVKLISNMSATYIPETLYKSSLNRKELEYSISDVPTLIKAIKTATERAFGGQLQEFTDRDLAGWKKTNPCKSRTELEPFYTRRKFVKHVKPNRKWLAVLKEYEKLHRTCMQKIEFNATKYFMARNDSSGCKFTIAGGPVWAGLGNKVLPTLAVLLYAVLTQRVLLVPVISHIPEFMCEPFEGSSWGIDPDMLITPSEKHEDVWRPFSEFEAMVDNAITQGSSIHNKGQYALRAAHWCQPVARFFCNLEQSVLHSEVPWIYFSSCVTFIPKLFAIPAFQPVLEDLFPDRMAATHVIRSVMYPADTVWRRVKNVARMYLKNADRRVGVQIRYRDLHDQFQQIHEMVNRKVLQCAWQHGILPVVNDTTRKLPPVEQTPTNTKTLTLTPTPTPSATTIFVTSLFPDLRDYLSEFYHRNTPPSGDVVGIYQLSHGAIQGFGLEEDIQALSEVICLSFSDDLFVTPMSTFGGMAQAYGALKPYFLEYRNNTRLPPCEPGHTLDPCLQNPATTYTCPHDLNIHGKTITDVVPQIKSCPIIDTAHGMQLMTMELEHHIPDSSSF